MAQDKYGSKYAGIRITVKRAYPKEVNGIVIQYPGIYVHFKNGIFEVNKLLEELERNDLLIKNSKEITKNEIIRAIETDPEYRARKIWEVRIMTKEEQEALVKDQVLKAVSRMDENGRIKLLNDLMPNKPGLSYTNITHNIRVPQEHTPVVAKKVADEPVAPRRGRPARVI